MAIVQTNRTKQSFWLAIGSFCSFCFGLVSSMILSRYFDKSDYGTYRQVLYVYNTLLMVFSLGLPSAFSFFLPRVTMNQAKSLIKKLTRLFFLLGLVFSCVLFVFANQIASILKNPSLVTALRVFSIVPFFMMPTMGLEGIMATFKKTMFMAFYNVTTRVIMLICVALPVMMFKLGYLEAIIGFVIGSAISFVIALRLKFYPVKGYGDEECNISYKQIFKFSIPLLYASLWGILINSADQFYISRFFGNEVFADFSNGSFELPFVGMVTGACSSVLAPFFSRMSFEKVNLKEEVLPVWKSVYEKTIKLLYPVVVFCLVFADVIMIVLYGNQYEVSGVYFRIKLITYFFTLIVFAPLIINTGNVKFYSNAHMVAAFVIILLEFISILTIKSPIAISWISTSCRIGFVLVMLLFVANLFSVRLVDLFPIKVVLKVVVPSFLILIMERFLLLSYGRLSNVVVLLLAGVTFLILYYFYSKVAKLQYFDIIKPLFSK